MNPIGYLFFQVGSIGQGILSVYGFILLVYILLNLLVQVGILSAYKPLFRGITLARILTHLNRWYEPPLRAIRKYVPGIGGLDFSPLVLFLAIEFVGYTFFWVFSRIAVLVG